MDELAQAVVTHLALDGAGHEVDEAGPCVLVGERALADRDDLLDAPLEERVDELLLVREAAVGGPDPDAGVAGDLVQADRQPLAREELAGGLEQAGAVALGVGAERARRRLVGHGHLHVKGNHSSGGDVSS